MTVDDDSPVITGVSNVPGSVDNVVGVYSDVSDVDFSYGADGAGSIALANGTAIAGLEYVYNADGSVTAFFDNGTPLDSSDDIAYFQVSIDQTDGTVDVELFTDRPSTTVTTPLNFSNIAPGNYTTVTIEGATFDGGSYPAGATDPSQFINDGSTINPSGNGFGIANNLVNNGEGFIFSYDNATGLDFDFRFQNATQVEIKYLATDENGTVFTGSITVYAADAVNGLTPVSITGPNGEEFDTITLFFNGNNKNIGRVENFAVSETNTIFPDDQVIDFDVVVTDEDGDEVTLSDGVAITFEGGPTTTTTTTTVMELLDSKVLANDNDTLAGITTKSTFDMRSEIRPLEMATVAAMASGFFMPEVASELGQTFGEPAFAGRHMVNFEFAAPAEMGAQDLPAGYAQSFEGFVQTSFEMAGGHDLANILSGQSDFGGRIADMGSQLHVDGGDLATMAAEGPQFAGGPSAFEGFGFADAGSSMEALLMLEAPAKLADAATVQEAGKAVGEAVADIVAEAQVDAIVDHFAASDTAALSVAPMDGLLDSMIGNQMALHAVGVLTQDQNDEAAALAAASA